jgi:FAD/FMN-containing dehydrogenase
MVTFTRRALLRAVGAGAVAASGVSCTSRSPGPPPAPASPAPPSSTAAPVPPDWAALRARLPGGLVLRGEPGYDAARRPYNTLFETRTPAAVAACTRPEDVQACVEVARNARIPIAARSGGHSYAGYSTPDAGLVADLSRMSTVEVRADGTAEIGAGARLIDVYAGLARAGRCLPAGSCPTVGVAGLTLGGGIGVLSRKFGLTCDRLVSATVVTADGRLRTASADSEPDLFWALRGGGGGNFGIVTSFTFSTEPAPDLTVFALQYPAGSAPDVLGAWQGWIAGAPDELWSNCVISAGSPPSVRVGGCYVGPAGGLNSLLDGLRARPASRSVQGKGFLDAMRYFAGCSQRSIAQCHLASAGGQLDRAGFVGSSRMLPETVADPAHLVSIVDGRSGVDVLLDSWRGAISRVAPTDTAFPHRAALASAQIYAAATPATRDRATKTVAEVRDGIGALTGNKGYVNYIDPAMPDWQNAYYDMNLPRLRNVAHRYDPDAVYSFAQRITP